MKTKIGSTKIQTSLAATEHQLESLDMDYDMWAGQFQIMVPFAEMSNDDEVNCDDAETINNMHNHNLHGGGSNRSGKVMPPLTQILDSEDVFLSLHPSDFESLNIVGGGTACEDQRRQQQWNTFFPKAVQIGGGGISKGKESFNSNKTMCNEPFSAGETEALQHRLSEQVKAKHKKYLKIKDKIVQEVVSNCGQNEWRRVMKING